MQCPEVQQSLNYLCDRERLSPAWLYLAIGRHWLTCADCRETWRRLRQLRQLSRQLPQPPVSPSLTERVLAALPEPAPATDPRRRDSGRRQTAVRVARAAVGTGLVVVGLLVFPWNRDQPVGAAVEAAVQGANTWHLKGWKLRDGQRIPWEIWGRRTPFFYREQVGNDVNFDDGTQRVRLIPIGGDRQVALRLSSGEAPSDQWRQWLTMGAGWRNFTVIKEARDQILLHGGLDGGMQGPYSVARDYFRVDKRTWLPLQWEYRLSWSNSKAPEQVIDTLQAEYDVPLPAAVTTLRLPAGVRLIDALATPAAGELPTQNVQRAQGLTVQAEALALDPDGSILVRVRSWLGRMKLGDQGTGTFNNVRTSLRYLTVDTGQPPPPVVETGYRTEDDQAYVPLPEQRLILANGDDLILLAPLEPRPAGAALPRSLTMEFEVTPQVATRAGNTWSTAVLFFQEFTATLILPEQATPIRMDQFLPPGDQHRVRSAPGVKAATVAGNVARARAAAYGIARRYERAIYWQQQALAGVRPFTNDAQLRRLDLAQLHAEAGDRRRAAAMYQEVIRVSRQHPETWNYYAHQAKGGLEYLSRPPRRSR